MDWLKRTVQRDRLLGRARARAAEIVVLVLGLTAVAWIFFRPFRSDDVLLHVAYDASRECFAALGASLPTGADGSVRSVMSSHGGSFLQMEAVARGLVADTICLATPLELDRLADSGLVATNWREAWPHGASPFFSTIVFVVPAGNPKSIHSWSDLSRPEINVVAPSPRVSGAGIYAFLALLQDLEVRLDGDPVAVRRAATEIYRRARLLDLGAQQALQTFVRLRLGDVFLTWESEARRLTGTPAGDRFMVVHPPRSILAEPVVAEFLPHLEKRGSGEAARHFLAFLFGPEGQAIAASHGLRPRQAGFGMHFPDLVLASVPATFGSWEAAWTRHLGPDGTFDWIERVRAAHAGGIE